MLFDRGWLISFMAIGINDRLTKITITQVVGLQKLKWLIFLCLTISIYLNGPSDLNHFKIKTLEFCTTVHSYFVYRIKLRKQASVNNSSCECKKVISDILGEIKFVVNIENTCKMTHFESWYKSQLKIFTFLSTKQDVKKQWNTKEIWAQNCFFPQNDKYALTTFLHSTDEL